jgi:tetratricopeptide (TPR) repeat protein
LRADSCLLAPILFMAALSAPSAQASASRQSNTLSVSEAVALYAQGEFEPAVQRLETRNLMVRQFTRGLDAWTAAGDQSELPRRKRVAAAFALDAVWHMAQRWPFRLDINRDPWTIQPRDIDRWRFTDTRAAPVVAEWVIAQVEPSHDTALASSLVFAAIGVAQDACAWNRLEHVLIPDARRLLGDHPRLRLADVIARTNRDLGTLRVGAPPARLGVLRDERLAGGTPNAIRRAVDAFTPLTADASVGSEAELRIGYLELRRKQWDQANKRFETTRASATEPILRATADYFAGWVHEQLGQHDQAVAAYRRAHAITPLMRNLTTRLSALLYLRGERAEAFQILDGALNARPSPVDLLFVFERADARFVPERLATIRQGLR